MQTITNFGMAKQVVVICWLQMKKPIVRCALAANTNIKLQQTTCIDCPAGTARATHDNDDDPWDGGTNNNVADLHEADCIDAHLVNIT